MKKKLSIQELEDKIAFYDVALSLPNISMPFWSDTISKYHALHMRLCHMRGEQPGVTYIKADHII